MSNQKGYTGIVVLVFVPFLLVLLYFSVELANYIHTDIKVRQWVDLASHSAVNAYNNTLNSDEDPPPENLEDRAIDNGIQAAEKVIKEAKNNLVKLDGVDGHVSNEPYNDPEDGESKNSFKVVIAGNYRPITYIIVSGPTITSESRRYSTKSVPSSEDESL